MPRYNKILIDVPDIFSKDEIEMKIYNLIKNTLNLGLIHEDIAFRNIAIDEDGEFQWIDVDSMSLFKENTYNRLYLYFVYIKKDISEILLEKLIKLLENYI